VKIVLKIFIVFVVLSSALTVIAWILLGPVSKSTEVKVFVVPENQWDFDISSSLLKQNLIKNEKGFRFLLENFAIGKEVKSGGYRLSPDMNSWQVLKKITGKQDLYWVTISYCLRKEQVGEILASTLGWSQGNLDAWNKIYSNSNSEYFEGVYYPDTYLLPSDETPIQIAQRFIDRFNEKFAPFAEEYVAKNIKWTTGLKIASLISREAAGTKDMKLISGIIWNRLNEDMPLQIDSTMQYTLGKNSNGRWWGAIDLEEKQSDSPYNSYLNKGLPPTPICSPGVAAIEAALNPEETNCLFYLHDPAGEIHCAETYEEHLENIKTYLK